MRSFDSQTSPQVNPQARDDSFLNGLLLIDKPKDITSFDIIRRLQKSLLASSWAQAIGNRPLKFKDLPKLGHTGTLDPFATGLMIIAIGEATRLTEFLLHSNKSYRAQLQLGAQTTTGDATGEVTLKKEAPALTFNALQNLAHEWTQTPYFQTPPMYSAKKINGQKLYELARQGIQVEREAIRCSVPEFKILQISDPLLTITFEATVSSGTFIRTLGEDFAKKINTVGTLHELRRLKLGTYSIEQAISLDLACQQITGNLVEFFTAAPHWIPFDHIQLGLKSYSLQPAEWEKVKNGNPHFLAELKNQLPEFLEPQQLLLFYQQKLKSIVELHPTLPQHRYLRVFHH